MTFNWFLSELEAFAVSVFLSSLGEQHERWHDAGIPTPSEAKKQGMTYADWEKMAKGAGV